MNLIYGEIVAIQSDNGMRMGKVRVRGALSTVPLHLVPEAQIGDTVLVCDGVAIGCVSERGHSCPQPPHADADADRNVRAPNARSTSEELDEQSKDPSIIGGINVSGSSR